MNIQEFCSSLNKKALEVDSFLATREVVSDIKPILELSGTVSLPLIFECEALHPGEYKGVTISEEEIKKAVNTFFLSNGNETNDEVNKDHKGNRKSESSISDLVGKILSSRWDEKKKALVVQCQISDADVAQKIQDKLLKFVSLRINPGRVEYDGFAKIAKDLIFEELSVVRLPADSRAVIFSIK